VFLQCLELPKDRCLTSSELLARVQARLIADTGGLQAPMLGMPGASDPESDFVFGHYR
jgi:hypothetical protein